MRVYKRFLSCLLACMMVICAVNIVSADKAFADLPANHWAYANVQTLVEDGTINGYTDGTFRPDGKVTRAEFVKMIGKTSVLYTGVYADVNENHWGYDYIMYSNMDVDGTKFYPDVAITRNDVVKLLYKRAGSPTGFTVPTIISMQCDKPEAVAWAYTYGIMQGDDGVDLRLDDGVTRAEAAALICRSRAISENSPKYSFFEIVSDDLLTKVYNSFELFDGEYSPERTFTYGEFSQAVMRLACDQTLVTYQNISTGHSVDGEYSLPFYSVCEYVLGKEKMTKEVYDSKINNLDAMATLMFAFDYKVNKYLISSNRNVFYDDVKSVDNDYMNKYISGAFENGIRIDNTNNLYPDAEFTAKNLALILLQMDAIAGLNTNYSITNKSAAGLDASLNNSIYTYPNNSNDYRYILKNVPAYVYEKPFIDADGSIVENTAKDSFKMARDYSIIYTSFLRTVVNISHSQGANINMVYYPSMVCKTDKGYVMRVKVKVTNADGKFFNDVFISSVSENPELSNGMEFYIDVATGSKLDGMSIPIENMKVTQYIPIK